MNYYYVLQMPIKNSISSYAFAMQQDNGCFLLLKEAIRLLQSTSK